jgi:hypothetical protein
MPSTGETKVNPTRKDGFNFWYTASGCKVMHFAFCGGIYRRGRGLALSEYTGKLGGKHPGIFPRDKGR